jgi:hypothetical protein
MYPIETQTFLDGRIGHPANSAVLVKSFHMPELVTPASSAILGKCFHMAELGTPANSRAGKGRGPNSTTLPTTVYLVCEALVRAALFLIPRYVGRLKGQLAPLPLPYLEEQRKKGLYVQTHLDSVGCWFLLNTIVGTQVQQ